MKWKNFPRYWPFVRGIHWSLVNSPHKGQWCGALMFTLICARINGWVNNCEAGDLRCNRVHHDVIVMISTWQMLITCNDYIIITDTFHGITKLYESWLCSPTNLQESFDLLHWSPASCVRNCEQLSQQMEWSHDLPLSISLTHNLPKSWILWFCRTAAHPV